MSSSSKQGSASCWELLRCQSGPFHCHHSHLELRCRGIGPRLDVVFQGRACGMPPEQLACFRATRAIVLVHGIAGGVPEPLLGILQRQDLHFSTRRGRDGLRKAVAGDTSTARNKTGPCCPNTAFCGHQAVDCGQILEREG